MTLGRARSSRHSLRRKTETWRTNRSSSAEAEHLGAARVALAGGAAEELAVNPEAAVAGSVEMTLQAADVGHAPGRA